MRSVPSSIRNKKRFLRWFIETHLTNDDDVSWFLDDLLLDEKTLLRMRFVEQIDSSPKGFVISTLPEDELFLFFKGQVRSDNVYTAYHELQLYDDELFFVQIKFPAMERNRLYQMLLREERTFEKRNKAIATHLLNHLLQKEKEALINQKINWSLDTKNKKMFDYYTNLLNKELNKLS